MRLMLTPSMRVVLDESLKPWFRVRKWLLDFLTHHPQTMRVERQDGIWSTVDGDCSGYRDGDCLSHNAQTMSKQLRLYWLKPWAINFGWRWLRLTSHHGVRRDGIWSCRLDKAQQSHYNQSDHNQIPISFNRARLAKHEARVSVALNIQD